MTRNPLLLIFFSLICILPATATNAFAKRGLFGAGVRFAWDNYKKPILVHEPNIATQTGSINANSFGGPNFGGELQVNPINRLAISLSIDMNFTKHTIYPFVDGTNDLESKASCFAFGALLGGKFYIIEPEVKSAALYAHLAAGKYFAKVKNSVINDKRLDINIAKAMDAEMETIGDLASPVVVQIAIGAEYIIADAFSIGADILGFRMGISKSSVGQSPNAGAWSGEHKLFTFTVYSALTMNFTFAGGGGKRSSEEGLSEDAWGAGSAPGAGAAGASGGDTNNGWGNAGGAAGAPANDGWGQPAPEAGDAGGGWGTAPGAEAPADGWEAQPPPPPEPTPAGGGGGGGGGGKAKSKAKPKAAAPSSPPPPPPGY